MPAVNARALAALILLVLIWGYSWVIMKEMTAYASPFDFAALRYVGGALVLFALLWWQGASLRMPPFWPTLWVGLGQTTAFQGLAQWALIEGGAGKVALFCYSMPFWLVFLSWALLAEKPHKKQWQGLALAALGMLLVIAPWAGVGNGLSVVLALGGGLAWAFGTAMSKKNLLTHRVSLINFTAWQMLLGSLVLCVLAFLVPSKPIVWSGHFLFGLAFSVLLASSLAWVLWGLIVRELPTALASLSSLLVPVCAILLAWVLLAEVPAATDFAGIVLILLALIIVRPSHQKD